MRTRVTMLSLAALVLAAATANAQAKKATMCNDGTTSAVSGRGACSGHGGVKKAEGKKAEKAESKKAEKAEAKKEEKGENKSAKKAASAGAPKTVEKKVGAQVTCTDGTMSKPGRGACSGHGGVKKG